MDLEQDEATHVVTLSRDQVLRLLTAALTEARSAAQLHDEEQRERMMTQVKFFRTLLRKWIAPTVHITRRADWWLWVCQNLADGEIGLAVGRQLPVEV